MSKIATMAPAVEKSLPTLLSRPPLEGAIRQRAKFEGWLKIELAQAVRQNGLQTVLELYVPEAACIVDIASGNMNRRSLLMLKTVNTNFRFAGIENKSRPITKNVANVINDIAKLRRCPVADERLVALAVFPMIASRVSRDQAWHRYYRRIAQEGIKEETAGFVRPPYSDGEWGLAWWILRV